LTDRSLQHSVQGGAAAPKLPPRWFIRAAWIAHRAVYRFTGGRRGLAHPKPGGQFGYLRLKSTGRRSGKEREAILGYIEDGQNLVTLAMNGWGEAEPAWWLNLQARPDATVDLKGSRRSVHARPATGDERDRLWATLRQHRGYGDLDGFARRRSQTAVVVLEPRSDSAPAA
jgi:deazaflavin-dependent oxidoreductase (nitroreductase family)